MVCSKKKKRIYDEEGNFIDPNIEAKIADTYKEVSRLLGVDETLTANAQSAQTQRSEPKNSTVSLFQAIDKGDIDGVFRLINEGVDLSTSTSSGENAIEYALRKGKPQIAERLLQYSMSRPAGLERFGHCTNIVEMALQLSDEHFENELKGKTPSLNEMDHIRRTVAINSAILEEGVDEEELFKDDDLFSLDEKLEQIEQNKGFKKRFYN